MFLTTTMSMGGYVPFGIYDDEHDEHNNYSIEENTPGVSPNNKSLKLSRSRSAQSLSAYGGPLSEFMDPFEEDDYLVGNGYQSSSTEDEEEEVVPNDNDEDSFSDDDDNNSDESENVDHDNSSTDERECVTSTSLLKRSPSRGCIFRSKFTVIEEDNETVTTEATTDSDEVVVVVPTKENSADKNQFLPTLVSTSSSAEEDDSDKLDVVAVDAETSTSSLSSTSSSSKKSVRFGSVAIREHAVILGDHPLCPMLPLSLGWSHAPEMLFRTVDDHHYQKRKTSYARNLQGHWSTSCPTMIGNTSPPSSSLEDDDDEHCCRKSATNTSNCPQCCSCQKQEEATVTTSTSKLHLCNNLQCNHFRQGLSWPSSTKRLTYNERKTLLKRLSGLGESDLMRLERHRRRVSEQKLHKELLKQQQREQQEQAAAQQKQQRQIPTSTK